MRILWFTTSPSLGYERFSSQKKVGVSWIESLERKIVLDPSVKLGLAFPWTSLRERESFSLEGNPTRYFSTPVYPLKRWEKAARRMLMLGEPRDGVRDYLQIVEDFKPDIIHFFGTENNFPLIIPHLKVPSVIWFQGNLTVYQTRWESGFRLRKTLQHEKLKNILMGKTFLHYHRIYAKMVEREKEIFSYAQNITGRTDWDRRLTSIMAPQASYYHLEEAMRPPFYENTWKPHRDRDKFVITTTIRGNLYKGLETVMDVCQKLQPLMDKRLEWRIMGISPGSNYVKTARTVSKMPESDDTLKLLGSKSAPEIVEEHLNADLYVHPSHIDNSPNAVCEAMLLGMPVVSTNVGGIPSLIDDRQDGFLVQNADPYSMAGAVLDVYKDPEAAAAMGEKARKRGLQRNDPDDISTNLLKIYQQILS